MVNPKAALYGPQCTQGSIPEQSLTQHSACNGQCQSSLIRKTVHAMVSAKATLCGTQCMAQASRTLGLCAEALTCGSAVAYLLGTEMGMLKSLRMVVLIGAMRSTRPVTTEAPEEVRSSTLSPTTKGLVTNCSTQQI